MFQFPYPSLTCPYEYCSPASVCYFHCFVKADPPVVLYGVHFVVDIPNCSPFIEQPIDPRRFNNFARVRFQMLHNRAEWFQVIPSTMVSVKVELVIVVSDDSESYALSPVREP